MRNQLRPLLLRRVSHHAATTNNISHFHVNTNLRRLHPSIPSSSILHRYAAVHQICTFSSEAEQQTDVKKRCLIDVFSAGRSPDVIVKELEVGDVSVTHDLVVDALRDLENRPEVATRFFEWVVDNHAQLVSSKTYNFMLGILGSNGLTGQFWDLVEVMMNKGFWVKKGAYDKAAAKFEKEGFIEDLEKLRGLYALGSVDKSDEKLGARASKIVRNAVWDENVEAQLRDLNAETFTSDFVVTVLEKVGSAEPLKALIFFRWVEESGLFKHDAPSYNSMLLVLGREDSIYRFWKIAQEMKSAGCDLDLDTYVKLSDRFCKRKLIKELVDLYEFAMSGANKPSPSDATLLLRKIVVSKKFDMKLFSRVVNIYTKDNKLTDSSAAAVFKSLTSVGRLTNCNKIIESMNLGGYTPNDSLLNKIAFMLGCRKKDIGVAEFMEKFGSKHSDPTRTWSALIEGNCISGDLEKAVSNFLRMIQSEGLINSGYAFDMIVDAYCRRNKAEDAYKLLLGMVSNKNIRPWHDTYKTLITSLLVQSGFTGALNLLGLMKAHGFPPYIEPFIKFIAKSGTAEDAHSFLTAMSVKNFPSTLVVIKLFKALFAARRHNVAHDLLSMCPAYVRTDADVLNLFFAKRKSTEATYSTSKLTPIAA